MRKMMTKEVTTTTFKIAKIEIQDGEPVIVELPSETLLGNVSMEKAQREINKKYGYPVTILSLSANTLIYEMPVEEFIKIATLKEVTSETY